MVKEMICILSLLLIFACKKPETEPLPPPGHGNGDSSAPEMVWAFSLGNDALSINPVYSNGNVLFSSDKLEASSVVLLNINPEEGRLRWKWKNFASNIGLGNPNYYLVFRGKFIYGGGKETGVIDLASSHIVWQEVRPFAPRLSMIGDHIYRKQDPDGLHDAHVHLLRSPVAYSRWDTVFTIYADSTGGYTPSIEGPSLWIAPGGDSVLVFQNRSWHFGKSDGKIDFYAYNLTERKIQFIIENIEPTGNSNVLAPLVDGNYAYLMGTRNLHCIDLISGSVQWQKGFPGQGHHLMLSNLVVQGNKLIVKPDNDAIYAFDKTTGAMVWAHASGAGHTPSHMELYRGVVYYTADGDGKLYAVNANTGEIIWNEHSPHAKKYPAAFNGGVAIDPERGYIYAADYYYAMAFKLPRL